MVFISPLLFPF